MPLYVDDGKYYYDSKGEAASVAKADIEKFKKRFEVKLSDADPVDDYFLGGNRESGSLGSRVASRATPTSTRWSKGTYPTETRLRVSRIVVVHTGRRYFSEGF